MADLFDRLERERGVKIPAIKPRGDLLALLDDQQVERGRKAWDAEIEREAAKVSPVRASDARALTPDFGGAAAVALAQEQGRKVKPVAAPDNFSFRRKPEQGPTETEAVKARIGREASASQMQAAADDRARQLGGVRSTDKIAPAVDSWADTGRKALARVVPLLRQAAGTTMSALAETGAIAGAMETRDSYGMPIEPDVDYQTILDTMDRLRREGKVPGQDITRAAQQDIEANGYSPGDSLGKKYVGMLSDSLVLMVPAVVASIATRNPTVAGTVMGGAVGTQQFDDSREKGRSIGASTIDGVYMGVAESIGEAIPVGMLMKPGGKFLASSLKAAGAEGLQEMFTQILQTGYDMGVLNPDMTWGEARQQVIDAGIVGAMMGGTLSVATRPFTRGEPTAKIDSQTAPAIASRPIPKGVRQAASEAAAVPTQADIDSPLPTEAITTGRATVAKATASTEANAILRANAAPDVSSRVTITMPNGNVRTGYVEDAFVTDGGIAGQSAGIKIKLDDGSTFDEHFDTIADAGVRIEAAAPTTVEGLNAAADAIDARISQSAAAAPRPLAVDPSVTSPPGAEGSLPLPVSGGRITSGFGSRDAPTAGASTNHRGIDIAVPVGTAVRAPAGGRVVAVGSNDKSGNFVRIDHGNGVTTSYAHLSGASVSVGDEIQAGQDFARSGSTGNVTGPHLHYSVRKNMQAVDPSTLGSLLGGAAGVPSVPSAADEPATAPRAPGKATQPDLLGGPEISEGLLAARDRVDALLTETREADDSFDIKARLPELRESLESYRGDGSQRNSASGYFERDVPTPVWQEIVNNPAMLDALGERFGVAAPEAPVNFAGPEIDGEWREFNKELGGLDVPRAQMPQVKAEDRGALVNFLIARGIEREEQTVSPRMLKPTQREYSVVKGRKARDYTGGNRAILVSSDGYILDGHHQWIGAITKAEAVRIIRLNAPIRTLLDVVPQMPSATTDEGATSDDVIDAGYSMKESDDNADILAVVDANYSTRNARAPARQRLAFRAGAATRLGVPTRDDVKPEVLEAEFPDEFEAGRRAAVAEAKKRGKTLGPQQVVDKRLTDYERASLEYVLRSDRTGGAGWHKESSEGIRAQEILDAGTTRNSRDESTLEVALRLYGNSQETAEKNEAPDERPAGPGVFINAVGRDGLTDAERGGPLPPADTGNATVTDMPGGKSVIIKGASPAQLAAVRAAIPKASPLENKKLGGTVYSKKYEAKIRAALASTAPSGETRGDSQKPPQNPPPQKADPVAEANAKLPDGYGLKRDSGGALYANGPDGMIGSMLASPGLEGVKLANAIKTGVDRINAAQARVATKPGSREIGRNIYSERLTEDENGIRTVYKKDRPTIGVQETVELRPVRGGGYEAVAKPRVSPEYMTVAELDKDLQTKNREQSQTTPAPPAAKPDGYGTKNKIVTSDRAAEIRAKLKAKMQQLNSGVDPEAMALVIELGIYHIEAGARKFVDWVRAINADIAEMGEDPRKVRDYLRGAYMAATATMEDKGEDVSDLDGPGAVRAAFAMLEVSDTQATSPAQSDIGASQDAQSSEPTAAGATDRTGDAGPRAEAVPVVEGSRDAANGDPRPGDDGAGDRGDRAGGVAGSVPRDQATTEPSGIAEPADAGARPGSGAGAGTRNRVSARGPRAGSGTDYLAPAGTLTRTGSWMATASRNLDIIELINTLEAEKRPATTEEQALLAKFTGWGASDIANNLFKGVDRTGGEPKIVVAEWERGEWADIRRRAATLLQGPDLRTALQTTQYAHYTSEAVIRAVWDGVQGMGFEGGRVIEPGAGIGLFMAAAPKDIAAETNYTGIELDGFTAKVGAALLPQSNMTNGDFTKVKYPAGFFDMAIGNPPFSNTVITDDPAYRKLRLALHDYFFAKSIDLVRPGGLMVFITSRYTMDKARDRGRTYIGERADLLGAIRLPQTAFKENAGTEVVTDILFFQKRAPGAEPGGEAWLGLSEVKAGSETVLVNEYFAKHPEMVLGNHATTGSMYRANEYTVTPLDQPIGDLLARAIKKLPTDVYVQAQEAAGEAAMAKAWEADLRPAAEKEGGLYLDDKGVPHVREGGVGKPVTAIADKLTPQNIVYLKDMIGVRDALKQAQRDQLGTGDWEKSLAALNKAYDAFVKKHGHIQAFTTYERKTVDDDGQETVTTYRRYKNDKLNKIDVESPLLLSLESITDDGEIVKGPFLKGRSLRQPVQRAVESAADALAVTLDDIGRLDLNYMAKLLDKTRDAVIEEMGDGIYLNPETGWETADEYLSGDVRTKLEQAQAAAENDKQYDRNVDALIAVQPKPLAADDITIKLGAGWVPVDTVKQFASEVLGFQASSLTYEVVTAEWTMEMQGTRSSRGSATTDYGTDDRSPQELMVSLLNNRTIKVTRRDSDGKTWTDVEATALANEKARMLSDRFKEWVWEDAGRASDLLELYNRRFNNIAPRRFDGSHLTLPGLSAKYNLYPHQKRAVWRVVQTGNTYLAHAVGAGKTLEMIVSGMEMRRLGLVRKPMYVVPNHMLNQFASEFLEAYPAANIMVADDKNFHTDNRRRFMAQASLNNPDAIIVTHSSLMKLENGEEAKRAVVDRMIEELRLVLESADDRYSVKKIEKQIEALERRFAGKTGGAKDQALTFEEMGVDFMFIDEAHEFRKLDYATNRSIKGIDPVGSQKALDLFIKTRWLNLQNPGRSLVLASGTPVTNTMAELYTTMRYLAEDQLNADGIGAFDAWANMFGEVAAGYEQNAAGGYEIVERFAKFVNVPELMKRVRNFMDVLTGAQLGDLVTRPEMRGGMPTNVVTPPVEALRDYMQGELGRRIVATRAWKPSPDQPSNPDPIIAINGDARLSAIDMRFIDPTLPNDPGSKLNQMIDRIISTHAEIKGTVYTNPKTGQAEPVKGGTQIVFSLVGFGEGVQKNRGFNLREFTEKRLIEGGFKKSEIAWMSDANSDAKKAQLFKDMRSGKVRVLFGSPKNMGTGVNVQNRLSALHYLSPPWYPSDVEQPHGRIIRQGNWNSVVDIFWYGTKGTYDSTAWSLVTRKARFIEQALAGDDSVRRIEDISEANQYELAAAMAAGDERVIQITGLNSDIARLEALNSAHAQEQRNLASNKNSIERYALPSAKREVAELETALAARKPGEPFEMTVDGASYTRQKEAGEALLAMIGRTTKPGRLATYQGLPVDRTETRPGREHLTVTVGDYVIRVYEYADIGAADAAGLSSRIANAVARIPSDMREAQARLAEVETELKAINRKLGAPFPQAAELAEKLVERNQIQQELAAESKANEDAAKAAYKAEQGEDGEGQESRTDGGIGNTDVVDPAALEQALADQAADLGIDRRVSIKLVRSLGPGVAGRYADGLVTVALDSTQNPRDTLNHEAIHILKESGLFKPPEWRSLEAAARADKAMMGSIRKRYPELDEAAQIEEAVADRYARWAAGDKERGFIAKAFERMRDMLRALGSALRGQGFQTAEAAMRAIRGGEVGGRGAVSLAEPRAEGYDGRDDGPVDPDLARALSDRERSTVRGREPAPVPARGRDPVRALGIASEIERAGSLALVGRRVTAPSELAELAQIYRDPRYETLRVFFVKGNEIVHATGVSMRATSEAPLLAGGGTTEEFAAWVKETIASSGADGYYMLHNHPSGEPKPSRPDVAVTVNAARLAPGFRGHVIINSNKYGTINESGGTTVRDLVMGEDRLLTPSKPHPIIGESLYNWGQLARISKEVQLPGYVTLIGTSTQQTVRVIADYPASDLARPKLVLMGALRRISRRSGSDRLFIVGSRADLEQPAVIEAFKAGLLLDGIDDTGRYLSRTTERPGTPLSDPLNNTPRMVAEQGVPYRAPRDSRTHTFTDQSTEERFQEATKGLGDGDSLLTRARLSLGTIRDKMARHWVNLPNVPKYAGLQQKLRALESAPQAAKEETIRLLQDMVKGFTREDLDLLARKVILDDLMWEVEAEHELPFGLNPETLKVEKARVDAIVRAQPDQRVWNAAMRRKLVNRRVAQQLVDSGVLSSERIKNPAYFRHQVLDYARAQQRIAASGQKKLRSPRWAKRMGSSLDINANLLEAEFDWLAKALTDIPVANTIDWIKRSVHNILPNLRAQAKADNKALVDAKIAAAKAVMDDPASSVAQLASANTLIKTEQGFRQSVAMGFQTVKQAIRQGNLVPPREYAATASAMANDADDPQVFQFLSWILDNDAEGAMGAAQVLKAVAQRRAWTKALLGKKYVDPNDAEELVRRLAPEGYATWQPDDGKLLFTVKTIPEHVIDGMIDKITAVPGIDAADMLPALQQARTAMAMGGNKYAMILPKEVADTLNLLRREDVEGLLGGLITEPLKAWKRWVLINPRRIIKYNLNNLTGDLDAVLAGNPKLLRHVSKSAQELALVMRDKAAPSARYREAVERGVFDSGLSIQEIPEINRLSAFTALTEPASRRPDKLTIAALGKVWRGLQGFTQWRENVLRYAAYLDYVERIEAGESMKSIGYGASVPGMVDAVEDTKDRAALLARDLIGDYGAISEGGAWLRTHAIPFWSWMEINTRRYWRLTLNAYGQGLGRGIATGTALGVAAGARQSAWLAVRMAAIYGMITLWNALMFGDEEDELSELQQRQLHIILGRDPSGQIVTLRTQGALSDALSWFGFADTAAAYENYEAGRGSFGAVVAAPFKTPINKVATSISPVFSIPIEAATGKKLWPNVFETRANRDPWRNLFSTFSLENEYDMVMERPSRGYGASWIDSMVYRREPGEIAYDEARGIAYDWLRFTKGQEGSSTFSTPRSEATRDYKQARRFGDKAAEDRALERMLDLGMDDGDLSASLKRAEPLGPIAKRDRAAFLDSLTDKEMETFEKADAWYRETFR